MEDIHTAEWLSQPEQKREMSAAQCFLAFADQMVTLVMRKHALLRMDAPLAMAA